MGISDVVCLWSFPVTWVTSLAFIWLTRLARDRFGHLFNYWLYNSDTRELRSKAMPSIVQVSCQQFLCTDELQWKQSRWFRSPTRSSDAAEKPRDVPRYKEIVHKVGHFTPMVVLNQVLSGQYNTTQWFVTRTKSRIERRIWGAGSRWASEGVDVG